MKVKKLRRKVLRVKEFDLFAPIHNDSFDIAIRELLQQLYHETGWRVIDFTVVKDRVL